MTSTHRPAPVSRASLVPLAEAVARAEAEAARLAPLAADLHARAVDMADLLAELDSGRGVLDIDPADARQWARDAASAADAAAVAEDNARYTAEHLTRAAERQAADVAAARTRADRFLSAEVDRRDRWTSADGRTAIVLPRTPEGSPTAAADAIFAKLLAAAVTAKDDGRKLEATDVPAHKTHGRGPGTTVRQAIARSNRPLLTPWKAPRLSAVGKPLDGDALAALDVDGVCAEVEAAPGVWLPQAAVCVAETAVANGWTVAMERGPSGAVTVRAAGVVTRGASLFTADVTAVWTAGVFDDARSEGHIYDPHLSRSACPG